MTASYARATVLAAIMVGSIIQCFAQDTRRVEEPKIPHACAILRAVLTAPAGHLTTEDESRLDTNRIQSAIDGCPAGQAVELAADGPRAAYLLSPIHLRKGVTLLVDRHVTIFASRSPRDFEIKPGSCGVLNSASTGCHPLISVTQAPDSGVMGEGTIDGRGGETMIGGNQTWWQLAAQSGSTRWTKRQQVPRLLAIDESDNFILYKITLKNSPNFHVVYHRGNGFTAWSVHIDTPENAPNTDGIDPSNSTNITIAYSYISTGDDNVALKAGDGPVTHMSVLHNHFYFGHGMSIGSETMGGVDGILVRDLSLDGTKWGIRIKSSRSRGGLVQNITYDDVCIRNSESPILLDTNYSFSAPSSITNRPPVYRDIILHNIRIEGGGIISVNGLDSDHRIRSHWDGVVLTDALSKYTLKEAHADLVLGPGPVNFHLAGVDSTENGVPGIGKLSPCLGKFVPFPR